MEVKVASQAGADEREFVDPTVYVLYGLEVVAWIGLAIAVLFLWSPWS